MNSTTEPPTIGRHQIRSLESGGPLQGPETGPPPVNPGRHKRRCTVCKHPDRELIEQDFLNWRTADAIAVQFGIKDHSAIYRHAHAFGLFQRRRLNVRWVAEQFLECAERVKPDADSVLQAMRLAAHIAPDGRWLQPQRRVIITHIFESAKRTRTVRQTTAPQSRPNGDGRVQKKLARQILDTQQRITAAHHQSNNLAKRLRIKAVASLTAKNKTTVPQS